MAIWLLTLTVVLFSGEESARQPPPGAESEFDTDFSRHSVSYDEILSGGPPKDGIPSIDDPRFVPIDTADAWIEEQEPVLLLEVGGEAKIYPLQILTWHEIVNDELGGVPVTITYCPLCNTGVAFRRESFGRVLDFGTTGRLRFSNLIMYDRQTESWWQQATGEAIAGEYTGSVLQPLPLLMLPWDDAAEAAPDALVLSRETGIDRPYGSNPYTGYDSAGNRPFLYRGAAPPADFDPVERALVVSAGGEERTWAYPVLRDRRVVMDTLGRTDIVVFWTPGTASALDTVRLAGGRDVGSANAFLPRAGGRELTFAFRDGEIVDGQTGSTWNGAGVATGGTLAGERLEPLVGVQHFWFSANAFAAAEAAPAEGEGLPGFRGQR